MNNTLGPKYTPRNHEYKPFQGILGNQKLQKYPPRTIFVTPELFEYSRQQLKLKEQDQNQ